MSPALTCRLRGAAVATVVVAAGLTVPTVFAAPAGAVPAAPFGVVTSVPVGLRPLSVAVDSTTHTAYVGNAANSSLSVVKGSPPAVTDTIAAGNYIRAIALDPAEHTAYVVHQYDGQSLQIFDTETDTLRQEVGLEADPVALGLDPTTNTAYVANFSSQTVSVIRDGELVAVVPVGAQPNNVVVDPSTHTAYVANIASSTVSVITGTTLTATVPVGADPNSIAVDPTTHTVFVANQGEASVSVITGSTVTATVPVSGSPNVVTVDPTTHTAYVGTADGSLSVINGGAVTATATIGAAPNAIAVDPSARTLYVSNGDDGTLSVLSTTTNAVVATVPVGEQPTAIAVDTANHTVYVPHYASASLTVITGTAPVVAAVAPSTGVPGGGRSVTVTGTDLGYATAVRFGTTPATFTVDSPTQITAIAPAGRNGQTVDVTVTTPFGASATTTADRYKYVKAAPSLTTTPSADIEAGATISDTATLTGASAPTGTVTFSLFGPDDDACTGSPVITRTVPVTGGSARSGAVTVKEAGVYQWTAAYSGDANNAGVSVSCGDATEVAAGPLDHVVLAPPTATIPAGGSQTYTAEGFDAYDNDLGDVTSDTTFTISGAGSCTGATCTSNAAGDHTVTGTDGAATGTAVLTVTAGPSDHLVLSPATATIAAGGSQTYTAEGFDAYGNDLGDVTADTTFSISDDRSCTGATCIAESAGDHTVTGLDGTASGTATVTVTAGPLDHLVLAPVTASIAAGGSQAYTAEGFDAYDNDLGDVTADTTFTVTGGGSCADATCTSNTAGNHLVTGLDGTATGTATLTVTAAAVNRLVISPLSARLTAGGTQAYTVTAFDRYNNSIGDVTAAATFSVDNGQCTAAGVCGSTVAGDHTVTATYGGRSISALLRVVPGGLDHLGISRQSTTILAGASYTFTVVGYDSYGNVRANVSNASRLTIEGGSCTGTTCTATTAGVHVVTARFAGKSITAQLKVVAAAAAYVTVSPKSTTIAAGASQTYTVLAYDQYDNYAGNVSGDTSLTINNGGTCTRATCTSTVVGLHTVTATYRALPVVTATLRIIRSTG